MINLLLIMRRIFGDYFFVVLEVLLQILLQSWFEPAELAVSIRVHYLAIKLYGKEEESL